MIDIAKSSSPDNPLREHPPNDLVQIQLLAICNSGTFEKSTTLKDLLIYLCGHRHEVVSEYAIAVDALNRRPDFDPRTDATVRVQVSRLRKRLKEYYVLEGRTSDLRFVVPLGSHQVMVEEAELEHASRPFTSPAPPIHVDPPSAELNIQPDSFFSRRVFGLLLGIVALLGVTCARLYWQLKSSQEISARSEQALPQIWREILTNSAPVNLVLPNPLFFVWDKPRSEALMVRDTTVNDYSGLEDSPDLVKLRNEMGKPSLAQSYATTADTMAALRLSHFLDVHGVGSASLSTSDASDHVLDQGNMILIGTSATLNRFRSQLDSLELKFVPSGGDILNLHPHPGEPKQFDMVHQSQSRTIVPGIIAVLPGRMAGNKVLILEGPRTDAITDYLISDPGMRELQKAYRDAGSSPYFEAVISSETEDGTVLQSHLVAIRVYSPNTH